MLPDKVKELYGFRCQVCDCRLAKSGGAIAVGAHIRALDRPHDGPDEITNIICLCPKHNAQFDAFSFYIDAKTLEIKGLAGFDGKKLNLSRKHKINSEFFEYHKHLYEKANIYDGLWNKVRYSGIDLIGDLKNKYTNNLCFSIT